MLGRYMIGRELEGFRETPGEGAEGYFTCREPLKDRDHVSF